MARKIKEIKQTMTDSFISNETVQSLYGLDPVKSFAQQFSLVSLENILFEIVAFTFWVMESLFDQKEKELDEKLLNQKSGRLSWYRTMSLAFQYGFDLLVDSDQFDNSGSTAEQIANSKIIKFAAVNEGDKAGVVVIKIAGEVDGELSPITESEQQSFEAYVDEFKYAGTRISVINYRADKLFLNMQIEVDPLVLDQNGTSILEGTKPVEDAVNEFLKELPFNGELILQSLVDKLQQVKGVKIATVINAESSWLDVSSDDYGSPQPITIKTIPVSGYFKVETFDNITYVV